MSRSLALVLGVAAVPLGVLRYAREGSRESSSFAYDAEWLRVADRFAFDPGLPLVDGPQYRRRAPGGSPFHGAIADTAPDGWAKRVIDRDHARRWKQGDIATRAGPLDALDYLAAVDDESRIGALRFGLDEQFVRARSPEEPGIPPIIALARLVRAARRVETHDETDRDLAFLRGRGTSLGGMRPKCSIVDDDGRLAIGKFPSVGDERAVTRGEVLALRLARAGGIDAADARIVESDGVPVAMIRRFDREDDGRRIPYISAATMLDVDPAAPGEHAYTEIVDALRREGSRTQADIDELWRRIAFSILVTNVDDHVVNHGFVRDGSRGWRLSPAFDVNPFPERARELKTWISEESGPAASIEALWEALPYFRIAPSRAREMLATVEDGVAGWRAEGRRLGFAASDLRAFEDAFEHDERRIARRLARAKT